MRLATPFNVDDKIDISVYLKTARHDQADDLPGIEGFTTSRDINCVSKDQALST